MDDLIEALQIFRKYTNTKRPTHCEHDELLIADVRKDEVSKEDLARLEELGFIFMESYDCFGSFRFGSA